MSVCADSVQRQNAAKPGVFIVQHFEYKLSYFFYSFVFRVCLRFGWREGEILKSCKGGYDFLQKACIGQLSLEEKKQ